MLLKSKIELELKIDFGWVSKDDERQIWIRFVYKVKWSEVKQKQDVFS